MTEDTPIQKRLSLFAKGGKKIFKFKTISMASTKTKIKIMGKSQLLFYSGLKFVILKLKKLNDLITSI